MTTFLSYQRYTKDFARQQNARTQQILDQLALNLDNYINDLLRLSLTPYSNLQVIQTLDSMPATTEFEKLQKRRQIEEFLNQMIVTPRLDILQTYIIADQVYSSGRAVTIEPLNPNYADEDWYKLALSTQDPVFIPGRKRLNSNPTVKIFSIAKQIRSPEHVSQPLAVIKVDANYSGIEEICNRVYFGEQGGLLIMDSNENIIYSKLPHDMGYIELYEQVKTHQDLQFNLTLNGKSYLAASSAISHTDWTIISINSIKELNQSAEVTRNYSFLVTIICSLLACIVLFLLIRAFLNPLMRIIRLIKEVSLGNLSVRFPDNRSDEIGYLGSSFNSMVFRIKEMLEENARLNKENYETKYLQKEAQLKALSSQIRPHFIYNTLNTISLLVQVGDNEAAVDNIDRLSLILRGLANLNKEITLQTEVELLEAYLFIQKTRFRERLEYTIEIDKQFYGFLIPALTLQPLVENSVIHGCEKRKTTTHIRVYSKLENQTFRLFLEDDAQGMDEETLVQLKKKLESASMDTIEEENHNVLQGGIGMINVNRRIKLRYGEAFGLFLHCRSGTTIVEVHFPYPHNLNERDT